MLIYRLQSNSVERLFLLGVFQDYAGEVQKLNVYMLDYYRCLWSDVVSTSFAVHYQYLMKVSLNEDIKIRILIKED